MKGLRFLLVFFFVMFLVQSGQAQTFTFSPSSSISSSIPPDTVSFLEINVNNQTSSPIEIGWDLISVSMPPGWDYLFLYTGNCCPSSGMNPNGTLDTIPGNGQGYLRLQVDPLLNTGTGILKLWVYETMNPLIGDTVTFIVNASSLGIVEMPGHFFSVYPNPSSDFIRLDDTAGELMIFNGNGSVVMKNDLEENAGIIEVHGLAPGVYLVAVYRPDGYVYSGRFIKSK